jgi:hypothetical protein
VGAAPTIMILVHLVTGMSSIGCVPDGALSVLLVSAPSASENAATLFTTTGPAALRVGRVATLALAEDGRVTGVSLSKDGCSGDGEDAQLTLATGEGNNDDVAGSAAADSASDRRVRGEVTLAGVALAGSDNGVAGFGAGLHICNSCLGSDCCGHMNSFCLGEVFHPQHTP